jgi:hypothetical protein
MKFYITGESYRKLRNVFTNLNTFYIIDVDTLISESGLNVEKQTHRFIINTEIERLIATGAKSKRYTGIIYINSNINCDIITGIKKSLSEITKSQVEELTLLDDYDTPKYKQYFKLFDEIIFFPTFKKTKIIECRPIVIKK